MYRFPLAAVLNHRKFQEENLQKELGLLKKVLLEERKKLEEFKKTRSDLSMQLKSRQENKITISETLLYLRFLDHLSKHMDLQNERIIEAEKDVETKREELVEALKNRKVLEKLKEKGWQTYKHNMIRKEQSFMNEMAAVRYKQKQ